MTSQFPSLHPPTLSRYDADLRLLRLAPRRRRGYVHVLVHAGLVAVIAALALACAAAIVALRQARTGAMPLAAQPLLVARHSVLADGWTAHEVELEPVLVDLAHLGVHTHANWVVFELPFDTTAKSVRRIELRPRSLRETNVAALPTRLGCVPAPSLGAVEGRGWAEYTASGTDGTGWLSDHPLAPRRDGRVFAINVPTRVANAAACWDPKLRDAAAWRLVVSWESLD